MVEVNFAIHLLAEHTMSVPKTTDLTAMSLHSRMERAQGSGERAHWSVDEVEDWIRSQFRYGGTRACNSLATETQSC